MNENELQSRIEEILRTLLPTFQTVEVTSQRSFSIKFGHHNVLIDGQEPTKYAKRGVYDILVSIKNKPIILLELKNPNINLTDEDYKQGISYARLTNPITPITIISNGKQTKIFNTITNEVYDGNTITENYINIVSRGLSLAANDFQNSIQTLITTDQGILFNIINQITEDSFQQLTGTISEFNKPIIRDFKVDRDIIETFKKSLEKNKFLVLTGDAFVGKTTFLLQFFEQEKKNGNTTLYINAKDFFYPIFKKLANYLTSSLGYPISENKVLEWIQLNFSKSSVQKLTVIFDDLRSNSNSEIGAHISELKDIFSHNGNRIIIATDNSNYRTISRESDRNTKNLIGVYFRVENLEKFSSNEYNKANFLLNQNFNTAIADGGIYSSEYRIPRIWRLIIQDIKGYEVKDGYIKLINSIPSYDFITKFRSFIQLNVELTKDFILLGHAFIDSIMEIHNDYKFRLVAINLAAVQEKHVEKYLGKKRLKSLVKAGFIEKRILSGLNWYYVPKLPELIAGYSIEYLKEKFSAFFFNNFDKGYHDFMKICEFLPYGELVAAKIIIDIGEAGDIQLFSRFINQLIFDEPIIEISDQERTVELFYRNTNFIIHFKEGVENKFMGNAFPYLVLAHLAAARIGDDSENPHWFRFKLLAKIGNKDFVLRRVDHSLFHEGFPTFNLDIIGEIMQTNIGIIEPIVQAIQWNLIFYPDLFEMFFDEAVKHKQYQLLHRIFIASQNAIDVGNSKTVLLCKKIKLTYEKILSKLMARTLSECKTRSDIRKIEKSLNKKNKKNGL